HRLHRFAQIPEPKIFHGQAQTLTESGTQEPKRRQAKSFPHFLIQFSGISYAAGKRTRNYPQITQICADSGTEDLPRTGTSINRIRNAGTKEEAARIFSSFPVFLIQ